MTQESRKTGLFSQFWQILMETSEAAVAIHYAEPWAQAPAIIPERPSAPQKPRDPIISPAVIISQTERPLGA